MATTEKFNGLFKVTVTPGATAGTFTVSNTSANLVTGPGGVETVTYSGTATSMPVGASVTLTSTVKTGLGYTATQVNGTFVAAIQNASGVYSGILIDVGGVYYVATLSDTGATYHGGSATGTATTGNSTLTYQPQVGWNLQTTTGTPACFMAGTAVRTPEGEVAVETLKIGDLVTLTDGRTAPISWIGINTVATRFADPLRALPIRIKQNALGENLPARDLLLSLDHALFLDGILVQAGALINGSTIIRETNVPAIFPYYHVEVADHALIFAENVPAETFVDNISRMAFDNWEEHRALYGDDCEVTEMAYPRAKSVRQLPAALCARLGINTAVPVVRTAA